MHKIILSVLFLIGLSGCVSIGTNLPAVIHPNLSSKGNIMDAAGNDLPVRISMRLGNDQAKPTVIIGHGSGGVTSSERMQAFKVQDWGYNAVVVDHYTTRGIKMHTGMSISGGSPNDRAVDMIAVARWVKKQPWHNGKIAIIGYSQGGAGIWALTNERNMRSLFKIQVTEEDLKLFTVGIAMYPACHASIVSPPTDPYFPVQLHLAGSDDLAVPEWCVTFGNKKYEKYVYPGATHAFDYAGFIRNSKFTHRWDPEAVDLSQKRIKEYLDDHIKK